MAAIVSVRGLSESRRCLDTGLKNFESGAQVEGTSDLDLNVVQATRLPVTAPQRSGRSLLSGGGLRIRAYLIDVALGGFQPSEALTWPMNQLELASNWGTIASIGNLATICFDLQMARRQIQKEA